MHSRPYAPHSQGALSSISQIQSLLLLESSSTSSRPISSTEQLKPPRSPGAELTISSNQILRSSDLLQSAASSSPLAELAPAGATHPHFVELIHSTGDPFYKSPSSSPSLNSSNRRITLLPLQLHHAGKHNLHRSSPAAGRSPPTRSSSFRSPASLHLLSLQETTYSGKLSSTCTSSSRPRIDLSPPASSPPHPAAPRLPLHSRCLHRHLETWEVDECAVLSSRMAQVKESPSMNNQDKVP